MRRVAAHVFVADPACPVLTEEDFHHLARVLRLRAGEVVSACDGLGAWRLCEWTGSHELSPAGEVAHEARPAPVLTVGFALTKGDNPEWAVQKLTEAGVDRVGRADVRSLRRALGGRAGGAAAGAAAGGRP